MTCRRCGTQHPATANFCTVCGSPLPGLDVRSVPRPLPIIGYHATGIAQATAIMSGQPFQSSENWYDWLGRGVYFWQDAPERAWEWAHTPRVMARLGPEIAVIGAIIHLDGCMDLLDTVWTASLADMYRAVRDQRRRDRRRLPRQDEGLHGRDRLVIERVVALFDRRNTKIRAVRSAFREGVPIFPQSALFDRSHVQIAVRDASLISTLWIERQ